MYQGKNPVAMRSQHLLLGALNEILEEKEYRDISVSEVCDRAGVSRQTFYKLFGTKENLILFQLENSPYGSKPKDDDEAAITLEQVCVSFGNYVLSNYAQMQRLLASDLMGVLYKQMSISMSTCRQSFINLDGNERDYAAQFMAAGLCSLTQKYVQEHKKPDRNELIRLSYKIMSGSVYRQ